MTDASRELPEHFDSAGQTFSGRSLTGTGFDDDDGSIDPQLAAALRHPEDEVQLMTALARARLLVPVVAALAEADESGELVVEKNTEMAVVTLTAPSGERAMPVFTDTAALAAWDPSARPSPVRAEVAAQAAIAEQCDVLVLDLATRSLVVRPSMLWALAQRMTWHPPHLDGHVREAISKAVADESDVAEARCEPGSAPGELRVVLAVRPGLTQQALQTVAQRIGERIATDGEARARIDGLAFSIVSAGA
ncbi:SseB family protein [Flexivirga caeni]|uniref:SseB family protein n=1 Tax=Flexivirga caeni TaxID=2294115 RepID=A0A3M9LWX2_9MICO|nr:SseB family protein [Flexivirga caeni]RNI17732.1 SseB family protein [Flexivirga caeni]